MNGGNISAEYSQSSFECFNLFLAFFLTLTHTHTQKRYIDVAHTHSNEFQG